VQGPTGLVARRRADYIVTDLTTNKCVAARLERERDRLRDELTVAQCELSDARFDELEVEGLLTFAAHVIRKLSSLWTNASQSIEIAYKPRCFQLAFTRTAICFEPP
jgi:hypothetical protein